LKGREGGKKEVLDRGKGLTIENRVVIDSSIERAGNG